MTRPIAHARLRLYPRAWRDRYGDEMRALIDESPISLSSLLDLVAGAVREWARQVTRQSARPVSLQREVWRELLVPTAAAALIVLGASFVAGNLRKAGSADVGAWGLLSVPLVQSLASFRAGWVFVRRFWIDYKATFDHRTPTTDEITAPGLTRIEFWCWMAALVASCVADGLGPQATASWREFFFVLVATQWLGSGSRAGLRRSHLIQELRRARA